MPAHQGLEAQHFVGDPVGLFAGQRRWGVNGSWIRNGASRKSLASLPVVASGQMGQGVERWCHNQNGDQREEPNEHGQKVLDYEGRMSGSWSGWLRYGKVILETTRVR
jgi:hypothetical protein